MIILPVSIFMMGCLLELSFIISLLKNLILLCLLAHLLSAIFVTFSYQLSLPKYFTNISRWFFLLIFLLCLAIPLFGIVISSFIIIVIYRGRAQFRAYTETVDTTINLKHIKPVFSQYGEGGAMMYLLKNTQSVVKRTDALLVLGRVALSKINKIMYELLADRSDEIRLLAFNILDYQESIIADDVDNLLALINPNDPNKYNQAKYEKNLAILYWELIYQSLTLHELQDAMVKQAENYALSAAVILKDDFNLKALLGRIYLFLKQLNMAKIEFEKALEANISPPKVLPYLAEIEFKQQNYIAVKNYLTQSDTLLDVPLVAPVVRFWNKQ